MRAPRNNPRINGISKIAYEIAGNSKKFYAMDDVKRAKIRDVAMELYDAGETFGGAAKYEETNSNGFVYVICHPRLRGIKIGRACNPVSRLKSYQTGCPERAYYLYYAMYFHDCVNAELAMHARLDPYRLEGEWFDLRPEQGQEAIEGYERNL